VSRELDTEVAEKVMGEVPCDKWRVLHSSRGEWIKNVNDCEHKACYPRKMGPPAYSTNIAAAWQVFEKVGAMMVGRMGDRYSCMIPGDASRYESWQEEGATPAEAICRAALKAVAHRDTGGTP